MWATSVGWEALRTYTLDIIDKTLSTTLVPEVILQALTEVRSEVSAGKTVPAGLPIWEEQRADLVRQLENVLHSQDFQQCLSDDVFCVPRELPPKSISLLNEPSWERRFADQAISNAIAFDIFDMLLGELIHFYTPQAVRYVIAEDYILRSLLDEIIPEITLSVARNHMTLVEEKQRETRVKCIEKHVSDKPANVLGSIALDVLLPWACGHQTGSVAHDKLEEYLVEALALDSLFQCLVAIDRNIEKQTECPVLSEYHAAINADLFFKETLELLSEHTEADLAELDSTEVFERIFQNKDERSIGEQIQRTE
ncbi:hypothetical protein CSKR_112893 [Clonorchis sinensis]|uniref:Uncharacterized protein n=1 Tax=Clonorchis sinensis TaxID=79923 RepID=A0A419QIK2_CLOSI|nr:hypothetical protein CSKR_112893 [Clonorchis sinensis]